MFRPSQTEAVSCSSVLFPSGTVSCDGRSVVNPRGGQFVSGCTGGGDSRVSGVVWVYALGFIQATVFRSRDSGPIVVGDGFHVTVGQSYSSIWQRASLHARVLVLHRSCISQYHRSSPCWMGHVPGQHCRDQCTVLLPHGSLYSLFLPKQIFHNSIKERIVSNNNIAPYSKGEPPN